MKLSLPLISAFLITIPAYAIGNSLPDDFRLEMKDAGVETLSTFDAPGANGILMRGPNGQLFTAYTPDTGKGVIVGNMYDENGIDLSNERIAAFAYGKLEESDLWFSRGDTDAPYVYIIDDPMCPYCHQQYDAFQEAIESGHLQIRHLIVSVLGDQSERAAHAITSSKSPADAYEQHHAQFDDGGISSSAPSYEQKQILEERNKTMNELGVGGTPAIFYQAKDGQFHKIGGYTEDVAKIYGDLGILIKATAKR